MLGFRSPFPKTPTGFRISAQRLRRRSYPGINAPKNFSARLFPDRSFYARAGDILHRLNWRAQLKLQHDPNRPKDVLNVDADENGVGGDDAADCMRYLVATKSRIIAQSKLRGL
jgi:hypothetical protein